MTLTPDQILLILSLASGTAAIILAAKAWRAHLNSPTINDGEY